MAVEVEGTSQLEEFLRVLRKRAWFIVVPAALIITLGSGYAVIVPKKFVSSTRIMVRDTTQGPGASGADNTAEGRVAEHTIRSPKRVRSVLNELVWDEYTTLTDVEAGEYEERTLKNLWVETPAMDRYAGQQLVKIAFAHTERVKARDFLEKLTLKWQSEVLERNHNTVRKALEDLKSTLSDQYDEYDEISKKLVDQRRTHDIPPPDAGVLPTERPMAPQWAALKEEQERYTELAQEVDEESVTVAAEWDVHDRMDDQALFTNSVEGEEHEKEIEKKRQKITDLQKEIEDQRLLPAHSRYKSIQSEIRVLDQEIIALVNARTDAIEHEVPVENLEKVKLGERLAVQQAELDRKIVRRDALKRRVDELEMRTKELQDVYQSIADLEAERRRANEILTATQTAYHQVQQEYAFLNGPSGNPFDILDEVNLPNKPTEPDPLLIVIFSILAGLAVGLGLAVLTEYSKSCFRSAGDISRVMVVPVLGTVNTITTRRQQTRALVVRGVLAGATLSFVGTFAYVIWAWSSRPELLSESLLESIQDLREALK
jgi:uncharacterized protein involved in exopolysaccharide biosynthesis